MRDFLFVNSVFLLLTSIYLYVYYIRDMEKTKRYSASLISIIIATIALLILDISLGIVFTVNQIEKTTKIIQSKIMENAYTAASLLNGDEVGYLTYDDKVGPDGKPSERYQRAYDILNSFKTSSEAANGDLAYIYLLVKKDNKIVFSIDPSDDPGIFLEEEPVYSEAMGAAFLGTAGVDDKPYKDRWGNLYSGYVPIRNSNEEVVAVVGVDVWADYLDIEVSYSTMIIITVALVTIGLGVGISLIITITMRHKLKRTKQELASLEEDVQNLVGDVETSIAAVEEKETIIEEEEEDNVENINKKLTKLRGEIRRYMVYAHEQASIDRLTHVGNRNAYAETVNKVNEQIKNGTLKELVVGIYDANGLKGVNDSTGHEFGDHLLKISAKIIQNVFGSENTYRIGGDEFVIIYFGKLDEFHQLDMQCQRRIDEFNQTNTDMPFILSLSLGVATYEVGQDLELLDVFRKADKAMYENKKEFYSHHQ